MNPSPVGIGDDLAFIQSMFGTIARYARQGYADEGRGAMIVDLRRGPEIGGGYLSVSRLLVELGNLPDGQWEQTLQGYDPGAEFVVIVRRPDSSLHGYVLGYGGVAAE